MFEQCEWINEPPEWKIDDHQLQVITGGNTDFWRQTQYGFIRDTGHCFAHRTTGDFSAQVHVQGEFNTLYDQAALMVRVDETTWLKAGAEFTDGALALSTVLTVSRSDWGLGPSLNPHDGFWVRLTVSQGVLRAQYSIDGARWPLLRLAPFPVAQRYRVGPMCCSPEREGLSVTFSAFEVGEPLQKDLHDLT